MKNYSKVKLVFGFCLIQFFFFVGCKNNDNEITSPKESSLSKATSGSWYTQWSNSGNGHIAGWGVSPLDRYSVGYIAGGQSILAVNGSWANIMSYGLSISGGQNFYTTWTNNGNGKIGTWIIGSNDKYSIFNSYILTVKPNYAELWKILNNGYNWYPSRQWSNYGNNYIGSWQISSSDIYLSADFYSGSSGQELLIINRPWSTITSFSGSSWSSIWSNGGNGKIGGWVVGSGDEFRVDDYDGDGYSEILCIARNGTYAGIFKFNGSNWTQLWTNGGNNYIGSWQKNTYDKYVTGNIDNVGNQKKFFSANHSSHYAILQKFNGSGWTEVWSNGGNNYIGSWQISSQDRFLSYKSPVDQKDYLVILNPTWGTMIRYNP